MIKFSIITPNYNSGPLLERANKSLKKNKCSYEHIIIDDCSNDNSCEDLAKDNNSNAVIVKNNINIGPGLSRNKGLDIARGEYILFLDSDDYLEDNALDILNEHANNNGDIDLIIFNYSILKKNKIPVSGKQKEKIYLTTNELIYQFMKDDIVSAPWSKCFKSSIAKKFRFEKIRVQEDSLYNIKVFSSCQKTLVINDYLYVFDKSYTGSLTTKPFTKKEMLKFYKGWSEFEKYVQVSNIENKESLIALRKIKFCCLYYMKRLSENITKKPDAFITEFIKKIFMDNIKLAKNHLSMKSKIICYIFIANPVLAIKLINKYSNK